MIFGAGFSVFFSEALGAVYLTFVALETGLKLMDSGNATRSLHRLTCSARSGAGVGVGMLMVLWFLGFMVLSFYGFIVFWFYGCIVLWLYGFYSFIVLWLYGFMVLWLHVDRFSPPLGSPSRSAQAATSPSARHYESGVSVD